MRGMTNATLVRLQCFTVDVQNDDFRESYQNFRNVPNPSNLNQSLGYQLVSTASRALPCNWQRTPNYDIEQSPMGRAKENNIFTANNFNCGPNDDIQTGDYILLTDFRGHQDWGMVDGAAKFDTMTNRKYAYVVPTNQPVIYPGVWTQ